MPRITSRRTRQAIFVVEESVTPEIIPENLALYLPDGTPMDLSKDGTRMLWRGEWRDDTAYEQNDVVIDNGDLFILKGYSIGVGGVSPSEENDPADLHTEPFPGSGEPAVPLEDGEIAGPYVEPASYAYFDLISGGTITITDEALPTEYIQLYTAAGENLGSNFSGLGTGFGAPLVKTDAPAGRYFVKWQEAIVLGRTEMHLHVVLSEGAQFNLPLEYWDVLFRASSGPTGPEGPVGPEGPEGPAGTDGQSFLEAFQGDWIAGDYPAGTVVRHTAGLYLATTVAVAADEPGVSPDPNPWELMIQGV